MTFEDWPSAHVFFFFFTQCPYHWAILIHLKHLFFDSFAKPSCHPSSVVPSRCELLTSSVNGRMFDSKWVLGSSFPVSEFRFFKFLLFIQIKHLPEFCLHVLLTPCLFIGSLALPKLFSKLSLSSQTQLMHHTYNICKASLGMKFKVLSKLDITFDHCCICVYHMQCIKLWSWSYPYM